MDSIPEAPLVAQISPQLMPRFQDGTINLQEPMR